MALHWLATPKNMGVGRIFPGGGKTDEISFFLLEIKKTTFFTKNVTEKCQISNPGALRSPLPTSMPMN